MVIRKRYLFACFALALLAFVGLGAASGAGGGNIGIMDTGLFINVTFPQNGGMYNGSISNFDWVLLSNTSALVSCSSKVNGVSSAFSCSASNVSVSSQEGWNEINLSIISGDSATFPSILFIVDTVPPSFGVQSENPASPSTYASGQFYELSVNVSDAGVGVDDVWYEFNGTNYTDVYSSGSTYYFNRSDLAAGSYSYRWYANDSLGNLNQTSAYTYNVNPVSTTTSVVVSPANPATYGNTSNFSCSNSAGLTTTLYVNSVDSSAEAGVELVRGAGDYDLNCTWEGNENYTSSSDNMTYTVNKADPTFGMSIVGDDNITYGEYTDFIGVASLPGSADCVYPATSPSNDTLFGAGTVVFTFSIPGCANYTAGSITRNLTVNQAVPVLTFLANGGTANLTLTYGASANMSANIGGVIAGNVVTVGLDRDGVSVLGENGLDVILAGNKTYAYQANITGNQNYSDAGYQYLNVVVNRAASITNLSVNPASPIVYGNASNFSCSNSAGLLMTLYLNGSDASAEMGLDIVRAAGNYSINCTSSENENYTGSSDFLIYEITKAVPNLSLTFSPSSSVSSGTETNVSGLGCPSQLGDCKLYRDGNEVNNSDVSTLGAGTYSYEFNTTGNENYTVASAIGSLTVVAPPSKGGGSSSSSVLCYSNWTCTDWSLCEDGWQARKCSLIYERCYALGSVPYETQTCNSPGGLNNSESNLSENPIQAEPSSQIDSGQAGAGITGGAIGALSGGSGLVILAFAAIVLGAYGYAIFRKRKFQNSLEKTIVEAK